MHNIHPNTAALIKLASTVYDMYPHDTYALRHNKNNPEPKTREIFVQRDVNEGNSINVKPAARDMKLAPKQQGVNNMSRDIYPGQYNILIDRPNIEGTGHGMPLGRRPHNPLSYT